MGTGKGDIVNNGKRYIVPVSKIKAILEICVLKIHKIARGRNQMRPSVQLLLTY